MPGFRQICFLQRTALEGWKLRPPKEGNGGYWEGQGLSLHEEVSAACLMESPRACSPVGQEGAEVTGEACSGPWFPESLISVGLSLALSQQAPGNKMTGASVASWLLPVSP